MVHEKVVQGFVRRVLPRPVRGHYGAMAVAVRTRSPVGVARGSGHELNARFYEVAENENEEFVGQGR